LAVAIWKIETDQKMPDFSEIIESRQQNPYLMQQIDSFDKNDQIRKNGGGESSRNDLIVKVFLKY